MAVTKAAYSVTAFAETRLKRAAMVINGSNSNAIPEKAPRALPLNTVSNE